MRELAGLIALLGALVGILLAWSTNDPAGVFGLLLLIGAVLFLQYLALSRAAQERHRQLAQQIYRLEELLKTSQNELMAGPIAAPARGGR